jgi:hypothetical protein
VITARRGWLEKADVINTLPLAEFLAALRPKPGSVALEKVASEKVTSEKAAAKKKSA